MPQQILQTERLVLVPLADKHLVEYELTREQWERRAT
jgi:hypothetical protein